MKLPIKARPEDFVVEEVLRLRPEDSGDYAVYRATKRLLTTLELQQILARQLSLPPGALVFPALKDRVAIATQHFSILGHGPSQISGDGFTAQIIGWSPRHLGPGDLLGNRFIVTLHSLKSMQTEALAARAGELAQEGLPNYFDEQRFGSYAPGGAFIGKAILRGDAEGALRAYMAQPVPGDPPALRSFKAFARDHWRDWSAMFQRAPRSNHRSILTFLKDHPEDFRKALNLITPRLLPLLLAAYQSFLWNRMACRILRRRLEPVDARAAFVEIAGEQLILYQSLPAPLREELRRSSLPLPHHRAAFPDGYSEEVAEAALAEEGLELKDLKARLLKRAYLPRGARPLLVFPEGVETQIEAMKPGDRRSVRLAFFLSPGSYGTLVLKALAATVS